MMSEQKNFAPHRRIEIAVEINRARFLGLACTPFRRFHDLAEMGATRRCPCGAPAVYVAYCTAGNERAVACLECFADAAKSA